MPDAQTEQLEKLSGIFMPYAASRIAKIKKEKAQFVHYTTAENALKIIRDKRVYMRSTVCMNDYREVSHGMDYLFEFFHDQARRASFFETINGCGASLAEEAINLFDGWMPHNQMNIYVACISEHDSKENQHGRLSMWRAYARPGVVGIALVFNSESFFQDSNHLQTYGSPVAYFGKDEFVENVQTVVRNVKENADFIKSLPRQLVVGTIFNMLLFAAVGLKHPGFEEEREWRLIHLPKMTPSKLLESSVETINGVPQIVFKIPLIEHKNTNLKIQMSDLIDRVIIGPSVFPWPLYEAFVSELKNAGVKDAAKKVVISEIPLRT